MNSVDTISKYFIEKLGEKFWIATLIPSVVLVMASIVVFDPFLKISSSTVAVSGTLTERLLILLAIVMVPSVMIGFVLFIAQTYVVKLHSGYIFFHHFPFMRNAQIRRANKLVHGINALREQMAKLENKGQKNKTTGELSNLRDQYYALVIEYDQSFPQFTDRILPTRLGNILRASEEHSATRYGMDAETWWSRLYVLLPQETKKAIEESTNQLYVLLNFSILSICFYLLCVTAILYTGSTVPFSAHGGINLELIFRYMFAGFMALFSSAFFNRLSLFSAAEFGTKLRGAFDLHRLLLLEEMKVPLPKNSVDEFNLWRNLGELITLGNFSLDFTPFNYDWKQTSKKQAKRPAKTK